MRTISLTSRGDQSQSFIMTKGLFMYLSPLSRNTNDVPCAITLLRHDASLLKNVSQHRDYGLIAQKVHVPRLSVALGEAPLHAQRDSHYPHHVSEASPYWLSERHDYSAFQ